MSIKNVVPIAALLLSTYWEGYLVLYKYPNKVKALLLWKEHLGEQLAAAVPKWEEGKQRFNLSKEVPCNSILTNTHNWMMGIEEFLTFLKEIDVDTAQMDMLLTKYWFIFFLLIDRKRGNDWFRWSQQTVLFSSSIRAINPILASRNFRTVNFLKPQMKRCLPKCLCNGNLERRVQVHQSDIHQYLSRPSNKTNHHVIGTMSIWDPSLKKSHWNLSLEKSHRLSWNHS